MAQEQGEKRSSKEIENEATMSSEAAAQAITSANQQAEIEETVDSIDDLLDAIGDVLEENAEQFIAAYKQKGGQ